jgi:hypothetical protein
MRAYLLARAEGNQGQQAIDIGNSAYSGALPPYDMPLRTPVLACFGCGKSNVRYWRERERLALRPDAELRERIIALEDIDTFDIAQPLSETAVDELIAQLIRCYSIKLNGITHQEAMELVEIFYRREVAPQAGVAGAAANHRAGEERENELAPKRRAIPT